MILTCPNCSMRYSASSTAIGGEGRKVRCASCGHNWQVDASGEEKPTEELFLATKAAPASAEESKSEEQSTPEQEQQVRKDPKVAQAIRARREAERQHKKLIKQRVIWGGTIAAVILLFVGSWVFKADMVRIWPKTASIYSALGAKVNIVGLEVHDITAVRKIRGGTSVLQISGTVVNISKRKQQVPLLTAEILDDKDQPVFSWLVETKTKELDKGEKFSFTTDFREPPVGALRVIVMFADQKELQVSDTDAKVVATD
ncbi:MAG: zinc-ribbon domain-containing protein [Robiginitomaculum sp.]|nr:zinc-ribbon domain-containing protein [Robiginitomaculum sp.]